jgi:hypothetical protein
MPRDTALYAVTFHVPGPQRASLNKLLNLSTESPGKFKAIIDKISKEFDSDTIKEKPDKKSLFLHITTKCNCGNCYKTFARDDRVPWHRKGNKFHNAKHGVVQVPSNCPVSKFEGFGYVFDKHYRSEIETKNKEAKRVIIEERHKLEKAKVAAQTIVSREIERKSEEQEKAKAEAKKMEELETLFREKLKAALTKYTSCIAAVDGSIAATEKNKESRPVKAFHNHKYWTALDDIKRQEHLKKEKERAGEELKRLETIAKTKGFSIDKINSLVGDTVYDDSYSKELKRYYPCL